VVVVDNEPARGMLARMVAVDMSAVPAVAEPGAVIVWTVVEEEV
jgi:hypothetical protein